MAARVALLAYVVCVCSAAPAPTTVSVNCCVLLAKLHSFVATETDIRAPSCDDLTCHNSRLMQVFRQETDSHLRTAAAPGDASVAFAIPPADDAVFADILVWSFIGRHYTTTLQGTSTHFVFNTATSTMTAKMPKCEFQKPVYTILLFVSILLLIFSLVLQNLKLMEQARDETVAHTESSMLSASLDFAPRRKVVGGRCYTAAPFGVGGM